MSAQYTYFTKLIRPLAIAAAVLIYLFAVIHPIHAVGVNRVINFQGKVVAKTTGLNVANGNYDFTFKLYNVASSGSPIWTENFNAANGNQLTVTDGIFRAPLGSVCVFSGGSCQGNTNSVVDFNNDQLFLEITFNTDTMGTRVQFTSVPYALNAEKVSGLTVTNNGGNTLNIAANKTLTVSNTLTLAAGADSKTLNIGANSLTFSTSGDTTLSLPASGTVCTTVTCLASDPYWTQASGALFANNSTADLLVGGQSTASATFHLFGNLAAGTTPVASISANTSFAGLVVDNKGIGDIFTASSSGLNRFVITQGGNVGIGTTSPLYKLDVNGTAAFRSSTYMYNSTLFAYDSVNGKYLGFYATGGKGYLGMNDATSLILQTNGGSIGIGTTSALATLDVRGNSGTLGVATVSGNTSFAALTLDNTGIGDLFTASKSGATKFVINNVGNVGIGTANPQRRLVVQQDTSTSLTNTVFYNADTTNSNAIILSFRTDTTGAGAATFAELGGIKLNIEDHNNATAKSDLAFFTTNATEVERMRIDPSGNLGINTTSPLATLDVRGTSGTLGVASVSGQTSFAALTLDNTGIGDLFTASKSGATKFTIDNAGNLLVGIQGERVINTISPILQIEGITGGTSALSATRNSNDANGAAFYFAKSRGITNGSLTIVQNGDTLGGINFMGADGSTTNAFAAAIYGQVDGTPGVNDMPGRLVFNTTLDGAATSTERMRITNAGLVGIGSTAPTSELYVSRLLTAGATGKALAIFDQTESQDIFTASKSGATKFTIDNSGNASMSGSLTIANGQAIRSTYGPLNFSYKSGADTWTNGFNLQDITGYAGYGTTNPQSVLDLGSGALGRSLVWGGPTGGNWYASLGTSYASADVNLLATLKLDTGADTVEYAFTGTYAPSGIRLDHSGGSIIFFNQASGSYTAGNAFDYISNTKFTVTTAGNASASGSLLLGNGGSIKPAYGPLTLSYKSGANTWATGLTLQDTTGNVGVGSMTNPVNTLDVRNGGSAEPLTSGNASNGLLRINSSDTSVALDAGVSITNTYAWLQSRAYTNYATNYKLVLNPNGGNVGIGDTTPASLFTVGSGDVFQVNSTGAIVASTGLTLTSGGITLGGSVSDSSHCLVGGSTAAWGSCGGGSATWTINNGVITPVTSSVLDLLIGGTATASADFAFTGMSSSTNQTQASFSGQFILMSNNGYSGKFGIGTATPGAKLEISQGWGTLTNIQQSVNNNAIAIAVPNSTSYMPGLVWYTPDNNPNKPKAGIWLQQTSSGSLMYLGTSNAYGTGITNQAITINQSGFVGIGNNSPVGLLDVSGAVTGKALAILNTTGDQALFTASVSGATKFILDNSGNASMSGSLTIGNGQAVQSAYGPLSLAYKSGPNAWTTGVTVQDATGNVGIGVANPLQKLHINGSLLFENNNGVYSKDNSGNQKFLFYVDGSNQVSFGYTGSASTYYNSGGPIYFQIGAGVYKSTLDTNGLSINNGSTGPGSGNGLLIGSGNLALAGTNPSITNTGSNTLTLNSGSTGNLQFFGSSYYITSAGALNVASCSGCGSVGSTNWWNLTSGGTTGGVVTPINSTADLLIGGQSTASATFHIFGASANQGTNPVASVSAKTSFAALVVNNSGTGDLITASSSGQNRFVVTNSGNVGIGTSNPGVELDVVGAARIQGNVAGDDIVKTTSADFTQGANCSGTNYCATSVTTTGDQLSLITNGTSALANPSSGGALTAGMATFSAIMARPDGKAFVVTGNGATTNIYTPLTNTFSVGPPLTNTAASAAAAFQRPDGKLMIVFGNTSNIYDPAGSGNVGTMTLGPGLPSGNPTITSVVGTGARTIQRPDGKVLIILGGSHYITNLYDPNANSFVYGPNLTSVVATGSATFQRPDGKWVVILGNGANTNIYDPSVGTGGTFSNGPVLVSGTAGPGTNVFQLPDGRFMVINGNNTTNTNIYDPKTNAFTAGAPLTDLAGTGSQAFQRGDGKWVIVIGNGSKGTDLYDPATGQFTRSTTYDLTASAGVGALSYQMQSGKYLVIHGGNGITTSTIFDAGWTTSGVWTSEDLNTIKISSNSALFWDSNPQVTATPSSNVQFYAKTGNTAAALASAAYIPIKNSGDLIQAVAGAQYVKVQAAFSAQIPNPYSVDIPYDVQTGVWPAEGGTAYQRNILSPTVFDIKIQNPIYGFGGQLTANSSQGKSEATQSAVLDGVTLDNSNRLTLAINRTYTSFATASAGVNIASASADLGVNSVAGTTVIQRPDGKYVIIVGAQQVTRIYDPVTGLFSTGATITGGNNPGTGTNAIQRPDGTFLVITGGFTNTNIYDPISNTFTAGPLLGAAAGAGSHAIQRPDGKFVIFRGGGSQLTDVYDPFTNSMAPGPMLPGAVNIAAGSHSIKRPDGKYLIFANSTNVLIYEPDTNAFIIQAAATTATGAGGHAVQLASGDILDVRGASTAVNIYEPRNGLFPVTATVITSVAVNAGSMSIPMPDGRVFIIHGAAAGANTSTIFEVGGNIATAAYAGPTLPCFVGPGAVNFQLPNGKFMVICGNTTANTMIVDPGYNLAGTYISEPFYAPSLSPNTTLSFKNVGLGTVGVKVRHASTLASLLLSSWQDFEKDDGYIGAVAGDTYAQVRMDFQGTMPDMTGERQRVWPGTDGGSLAVYYRQPSVPIIQYWRLLNASEPSLLTLTSQGMTAFRFGSDGQAFTSQGGGWNSGGADLAERYTSSQTLQPGEVVVGDQYNAQNVVRSTSQYQSSIMGVVSTDPGFVAGAYTENSYPIALVGRVPVKVSTENGPIHAGDHLTSSSIPGYAMKAISAGRVLGTAIEDFNTQSAVTCPKDGAGSLSTTYCGTITAFINLTNYNGDGIDAAMAEYQATNQPTQGVTVDSAAQDSSGLSSQTAAVFVPSYGAPDKESQILGFLEKWNKSQKDSSTLMSEVFTGRVSASDSVITPRVITDILYAKVIKADRIEGLEIYTNKILSLDNSIASISALMNNQASNQSASNSSNFTSQSDGLVNLSSLNVLGIATASADLNVGGNSLVNGMLTVFKSITTPNIIISDFASFFGDVFFKKNVSFEGRPTFNNDTAGFAIINKGESQVEVIFDTEYQDQPVITASIALNKQTDPLAQAKLENDILGGNISYIITNQSSKGFIIKLSKPAPEDISFSWITLAVKDAKTPSSVSNKSSVVNNPQATQSAAFQAILNQLNN